MSKFFYCFALSLLSCHAWSQIEAPFVIPVDYSSMNESLVSLNLDVLQFIHREDNGYKINEKFHLVGCNGGPCKTETYEKITFEDSKNVQFYTSGKVVRKRGKPYNSFWFSGPMEIYYASNDQLFVKGEYLQNSYGGSKLQPTDGKIVTYWPNGMIQTEKLFLHDNASGKRFVRIKSYNEAGVLMADLETTTNTTWCSLPVKFDPVVKDAVTGICYWNRSFPHDMVQPSFINHEENGSYLGYRYYGTYATPEGISMTGFTWPMVESMGNGSVVYVEDEVRGDAYFSIFSDGKIDTNYRYEVAPFATLEFILSLDSTTTKTLSNTTRTIQYRSVNQPLVDIKTKGIEKFTGYGIDYSSADDSNFNYSRSMRIGFFKDGKLDGLGYKAEITQSFEKYSWTEQVVFYQYGFFKNDTLVDGKTHNGKGFGSMDNWKHPINPKFHYSGKLLQPPMDIYKDDVVSYQSIPINGAKLYVKSVNRHFDGATIDLNRKCILVQGSHEEGVIELYGSDDVYLITQLTPSTHVENCFVCRGDGIETRQGIETVYEPGGFVQKGLYYTYHYSYTRAVKKKFFYSVTCSRCKGSGRIDVGNLDIQYSYRPISF